jgi:rhamnosyltransferase
MKPEFSIIIPTKNSVGIIDQLIEALKNQDFNHPFEIIFLVTQSTDGTEDYLKKKPIRNMRIIPIPASEFNHSKTRMKGVEIARGNFVIFFTEDIIPIGKDFLTELTAPVTNGTASASYGVYQTDPENADPVQAYLNNNWYESFPDLVMPISPSEWESMSGMERRLACNFDNCASCIERNLLIKLHFPDVPYGEDMFFAKRLLLNNQRIALAKNAKFYHWHNMSFGYFLKRMCLDQHLSLGEFGVTYVRNKWIMIWSIKIRILHRILITLFLIPLPIQKKFYWIRYHVKILTADFLGKYIGGLTDSGTSKWYNFIDQRLFQLKKQILQEISIRSIPRY